MAALVGLNTDLRREYIADCQSGVKRWNRILEQAGLPQRLALPHVAFNRKVGAFAGIEAAPDGRQLIAPRSGRPQRGTWLPTEIDKTLRALADAAGATSAARSRPGSPRRARASTASRSTTTTSTSPERG